MNSKETAILGLAIPHFAPETIKKIAIIRRNGYGDLLCATPAITLLKKQYPKAEITLFVDQRNSALLPYLSCYDRAVIFKAGGNKYLKVLGKAWKYRHEKFDLAISAKPTSMKLVNLFLTLLGAKYQIAASNGEWHTRWISHPQQSLPREIKRHQALKCLQLLHPALEAIPELLIPKIHLNDKLPSELNDIPKRYIVSSVSNNRISNRLPPERHARLLNQFCIKHDLAAVISGVPNDRSLADAVMAGLDCPKICIISDSLHTLLHLLSRCTLAFSADGGFMHLTAAFDKPQLILFTTTNTVEWAPLTNKAICLSTPSGLSDLEDSIILKALEDLLS